MAGNFPYNVFNNIIVNNISTHEGGGVSLNDTPDVRFYNNTVMKNITTATAVTSNGSPAPAGLSSSQNRATLQATLPAGSPIFSNPVLFNNIFWDNRAGTWTGGGVAGIGQPTDSTPIYNWDLGLADGTGLLSPTNSLMQVSIGTIADGSNIYASDPAVVTPFDVSVQVLPWRGNPNFVDALIVSQETRVDLLSDFHLTSVSPAIDMGASAQAGSTRLRKILMVNCARQNVYWDSGADESRGSTTPPNQPPPAVFTFSCVELTCSFDASTSSDPDGNITTYAWDFGDGSPVDTTSGLLPATPMQLPVLTTCNSQSSMMAVFRQAKSSCRKSSSATLLTCMLAIWILISSLSVPVRPTNAGMRSSRLPFITQIISSRSMALL